MSMGMPEAIRLRMMKVFLTNVEGMIMKNINYILSIAAIAAMAAACSVEPQTPETPAENEVTISIIATLENDETKTFITNDSEGYHAYWSKGDVLAIAIDDGYSSRKSFTNQSEDGETANFTGNVKDLSTGNHVLTGFYPKDITVNRSNAAFDITIPDNQTIPSLNTFDKTADILIAKPTTVTIDGSDITTVDIPFRRAGCILKIILEDNTTESLLAGLKVSSITIASASDVFTGRSLKCYIDGSSDDVLVTNNTNSKKTLTVNYAGNDFEINGENAAYAIVAPNKFSAGAELSIDVVTNDPDVTIHKVVTPSSDITLNAGKVKPLRVKLNNADVNVNIDPTLTLSTNLIEGIAAAGGEFTLENAYSFSNCSESDIVITCDGTVVTAASISGGTITYTVSQNTDSEDHNGTISLKLNTESDSDFRVITVNQRYEGQAVVKHQYVFYVSNGVVVQTKDGEACDYFTTSGTSLLKDFTKNSYFGTASYTIGDLTLDQAKKIDNNNNVSFTTDVASSIKFYGASRSTTETAATLSLITNSSNTDLAKINLTVTNGISDLVEGSYDSTAGTTYTFKKNKEVGLFYIVVTEL